MTEPEREHGAGGQAEPEPSARPECDQYGHMIRAAEGRDETDLGQTLADVLTQHRKRHHPAPTNTPTTRLRSVS
ncbi:hypothetical protein GCM10009863_17700 [Streptomyces axinellae]|uniref:Uncharacterized protein n=1 Tax=Streptomyces axinellae TaxID=552788 RepID=A0ABP6C6D6_9ACTN